MVLAPYTLKGKKRTGSLQAGAVNVSGDATIGGFTEGSVAGPLTAHAGGTKAAALPLTAAFNLIGVCATANDSVLAPPAIVGRSFTVDNAGAAAARIFGQGTDTIDAVATATGNVITNAKRALFVCYVAGAWISYQYGLPTA